MAAEPYPVNPFRWHAILETPDFYQTAEVNTRTGEILTDPRQDVLYKPADDAAIEAAKQTALGKVYLDWGTWAVVSDLGQSPAPDWPRPNSRRIVPGAPSNSLICASAIHSSVWAMRTPASP